MYSPPDPPEKNNGRLSSETKKNNILSRFMSRYGLFSSRKSGNGDDNDGLLAARMRNAECEETNRSSVDNVSHSIADNKSDEASNLVFRHSSDSSSDSDCNTNEYVQLSEHEDELLCETFSHKNHKHPACSSFLTANADSAGGSPSSSSGNPSSIGQREVAHLQGDCSGQRGDIFSSYGDGSVGHSSPGNESDSSSSHEFEDEEDEEDSCPEGSQNDSPDFTNSLQPFPRGVIDDVMCNNQNDRENTANTNLVVPRLDFKNVHPYYNENIRSFSQPSFGFDSNRNYYSECFAPSSGSTSNPNIVQTHQTNQTLHSISQNVVNAGLSSCQNNSSTLSTLRQQHFLPGTTDSLAWLDAPLPAPRLSYDPGVMQDPETSLHHFHRAVSIPTQTQVLSSSIHPIPADITSMNSPRVSLNTANTVPRQMSSNNPFLKRSSSGTESFQNIQNVPVLTNASLSTVSSTPGPRNRENNRDNNSIYNPIRSHSSPNLMRPRVVSNSKNPFVRGGAAVTIAPSRIEYSSREDSEDSELFSDSDNDGVDDGSTDKRVKMQNVENSTSSKPIDEKSMFCVVCHDKPKNFIFIPCGHLCCCSECGPKVGENCVICRAKIERRNIVYR